MANSKKKRLPQVPLFGFSSRSNFLKFTFDKLVDSLFEELKKSIGEGNYRMQFYLIISKTCAWALYNHAEDCKNDIT